MPVKGKWQKAFLVIILSFFSGHASGRLVSSLTFAYREKAAADLSPLPLPPEKSISHP